MDNKSPPAAFGAAPILPFVAGAFAVAIFAVDTFVTLDSAIAALYAIVVLLAASYFQDRRIVLLVSVGCLALTVLSFLAQHSMTADAALVRCIVSLLAIGAATFLALENTRLFRDLAEREVKIRRLVDANIIGIFIWDFDGRILEANEAFLRILGYDQEDLDAGRIRWTDLTPPEWRDRDTRLIQEHKVTGALPPFEKEYFRKDGSRVPVLMGVATFEEGGNQGVAFVLDLTKRKLDEKALRESEYKHRQIIETVPSHLWSADPNFQPTHLNQRLLNYFGRRLEEFKNGGWDAFIHPDDLPETAKALSHAVQSGTYFKVVHRLRRADGEFRWHHARGEPLRDQQGRIVQWYGLSVDIDDQKRVETALREREAQLAESRRELLETIDTIPIAVGRYSVGKVSGSIRRDFVNAAWKQYTGLSDELALGSDWSLVIDPDQIAPIEKMWREALAKGEKLHTEERVRRFDGQYRWFAIDRVAVRDENDKVTRWYGTAYDIEERKQAEDRLRRSEAHLAEAQRLSHTGASVYNKTTILYWSDETYRIWGFDPAQGVPSREAMLQRIHPDDQDRVRAEAEGSFGEKKGPIEYRIALPDGTVKHLESISQPVFSASGKLIEVVATHADVTERKQADDRLRRSEAHLAEAQRLSHTGAVVYNGTAILFASEETYRIWGFDPAHGLPSREAVFQRIHPGDRDWLTAEVRRAVGEKRRFSIGYRILLPDGTVKHLDTIGQPVFSASGKLVEIIATQTDVTERKRAEEGLRESEAKFRDYAETASDWFWEIDPDYKYTLLTENAFGSNAAGRLGTACWDNALDLETEPEKWRLVRATLDARKPFRDFVFCAVGGNDSPMHVRASGKPMFDANGEFRGYRGTGTDVTVLARAQEALRESERRSRSAIDGIAGLITVLAPDGGLETVNRQCLEYFGRSLEELENWKIEDAVHPEDRPRILELFTRAIASGTPFNHELRMQRFDGEYRWFENRGVPLRDDAGRIARWYVLLTDIEDRTRALARLEQMQSDFAHMNRVSMMGELAASLSHEITQPIASARNNARAAQNFLDKQPSDLGEVREALSCVVGDTDRAGDIIDRIRDHIKKAPPRKVHFDLNEAINEVIALGQSTIVKNGVWVQTRLSEGVSPIHGDRVQLQQVVLNLLLNAAEAMGSVEAKPRELLISTEQDHTGVLVAVRDSGPGISSLYLKRVFDAFYTTKSSGTGMGLSICRSIIDAHGGRLWAEANEPRGAVFKFTLPAQQVES